MLLFKRVMTDSLTQREELVQIKTFDSLIVEEQQTGSVLDWNRASAFKTKLLRELRKERTYPRNDETIIRAYIMKFVCVRHDMLSLITG